ncbi:hypothetical protein [Streptomyces pseudovenezuelae]|uniref:Uncharacterized protein n=1 Tax=Streptomyces pseudovenezuelae TaxID=67350 RepID=A0ABT6LMH4_9ACTN|nr:hypothetical protein [Streptomyces pseudovenezuelae]MDH6217517.1 hypothetical protein [Streptomyces pseudovenezuelae]
MAVTERMEQDEASARRASGVSMRDLLASCAAARAVSTPPRLPDPEVAQPPAEHRKAA